MGFYNVVSAANMVSGQPEDVSVVLANFNAIATVLNGGIDNSNVNAAAALLASKLAGYPADGTKVLKGDGTWATLITSAISLALNIGGASVDLAAPTGAVNYWVATTGGGTLRSIGAGVAGSRITLKNGSANAITLKHALAGGTGAQLSIVNAGDKVLPPGSSNEFQYDGTVWVEVNRPAKELIATITLGADGYVHFVSIPQVYNHLEFEGMVQAAGAVTTDRLGIRLNLDAGNNYQTAIVAGNNAVAAAASASGTNISNNATYNDIHGASAGAALFSYLAGILPNYRSTTLNKFLKYTSGQFTSALGVAETMVWWSAASAAVNDIQFSTVNAANLKAGSTLSLYGIT